MKKKIIFIQEDIFPKLGAMYISSVFRRYNWEIDCLVSSQEKNLIEKIKEINPQVVGLSLTSGEYDAWGSLMVRLVKESVPNSLVMLGGPHTTYFPEVIEDKYIDMICIGEGEIPISTFCERWDNKSNLDNINGFWSKRNGTILKNEVSLLIEDLDTINFPDKMLYSRYPFISKLSNASVITSRGCPYHCSFCYNDSFLRIFNGKGKIVRRRSADNVIKEIKELQELFTWKKSISFADDIFWCDIPKGWLCEFSIKYKEQVGLPFTCTAFARWINEDTVHLLKKAGCFAVKMGVESANQRVRQEILKKNITDAEIYKATELLHKYKINFLTYNMLGIPTESYQDALNTYEFNRKIKPLFGWCSLLNPYKGTSIVDIAKKEGSLPELLEFPSSYFGDTPLLFDKKGAILRLQKFFPVGIFFNIPIKIVSWIILNIRIHFFYNLLFIFFYSLLIGRITRFTLQDLVILGLHTKVFKYFGLSKRNNRLKNKTREDNNRL